MAINNVIASSLIRETTTYCLLCGENEGRTVDEITGKQLRDLWNASGNALCDKSFGIITEEYRVRLFQCGACGFRFYDPKLAGNADFYEELMTEKKYPVDSPEFMFALQLANDFRLKNVLDLGCGEGAFLDLAREQGFATFGVELNRAAASETARRGHLVINKMIEDIEINEVGGGVDLLTMFQVVEHVSSPVDFVRNASRLVRPGGYIVIGVPSEKRIFGLLHYDPANWPPHHVSRWRQSDLARLASQIGLIPVRSKHDQLYGRAIEWAYNYHNRLALTINKNTLPGGCWLPKAISILYRYLGCKKVAPFHGLSIYTALKKPG